jgi:hypothetical protein
MNEVQRFVELQLSKEIIVQQMGTTKKRRVTLSTTSALGAPTNSKQSMILAKVGTTLSPNPSMIISK